MRLLSIESSPRGDQSVSIAVANAFLATYRKTSPLVEVDTLNVWDERLPDFDSQAVGAKYKGVSKEPMDDAETAIWDRIQSLVAHFQAADRILLGVPMWNVPYPYKLKQLIDLASQRNMLFTFDGNGYGPLLRTRRALVILARGQSYDEGFATPASQFDHQADYIILWLRFIGVGEVETLVVEHTWDGTAGQTIARGKEQAADLAAHF